MSTVIVKDGLSADKYFDVRGDGTSLSPHRSVSETYIQDQTTPTVILPFNKIRATTTLSSSASIDSYSVIVTSSTGMLVGDIFIIFSSADNKYYQGHILSIATNTITLDTPLDFAFPSGSNVEFGVTNMNVDGSVTPQIFGVRGLSTPSGIASTFDITRIIFKCETATAVSLAKFGDLTKLTRGLQFRLKNGTHQNNIFNVKSNGELGGISYDLNLYVASGPQGQDGFTSRLTFNGQNRMGVVLRIPLGTDLEFLVQDDLTGLTNLEVTAEGHLTED